MSKINSQRLREVAGSFATGVSVIALKDQHDTIQAMTANSFLSVSLEPPLILFSVDNNRQFLQFLAIGKEIGLSILSAQQGQLSRVFASQDRVNTQHLWDDSTISPVLKDALAWYQLSIEKKIEAGDHHLILCRVTDLHKTDQRPVLFFQGQYKQFPS